jgi:hypothetical protein
VSNHVAEQAVRNGHVPSTLGSVTRVEPKARRRTTYLLGVVALLVLCGLAAVFVTNAVQTQNRVVQVRNNISRGSVVKPTDLAEVTVGSVQGVSTVPAAQLPTLVGQRAAVDLVRGSLLPEGAVRAVAVPPAKQSLVGIRLDQGRMVIGDVTAQTRLRLIVTAPQGGDPTFKDASSSRQFPAVLIDSTPALDGSATLVNVQVAQADAALVAQLAATNRIAVVQDPQR